MSDLDVRQDYNYLYDHAYSVWSPYLSAAEIDLRFYLGDQWSEDEKRYLWEQERQAFVINMIKRTVDQLSGYQIKHRLSSIVLPVESSDRQTADQRSKYLMHVLSNGGGYEMLSQAFASAMRTGIALASVYKDYRDDVLDGDIRFAVDPWSSFLCDPYFSKLDWSDCSYVLKRKYLSLDQAQSLLPKHRKEVEDLFDAGWDRDGKFTWLPYQRQPGGQEMMAYDEMYLQKWKEVDLLIDSETAEILPFEIPKDRMKLFLEMYPNFTKVKKQKQYIERHILVNSEPIRKDINPFGLDEYPFAPVIASFCPDSDNWGLKLQSAIRQIIDPQRALNRNRSQRTDIVEKNMNSGWMAEENSVINPDSLFNSGQGVVVWNRKGSPTPQRMDPIQVPPSFFQEESSLQNDLMAISGLNDAAFGIPDSGNESAALMNLRQSAAVTNIQGYFENLRIAQKGISRKILKMSLPNSPAKVQRIINEPPADGFYDEDFYKYDISIQEGALTPEQKQLRFMQLVELRNLGAPITGEMLAEEAPIQGSFDLVEKIGQMEQQQAQAAQEQQQIQNQLIANQSQMAQAKAISDVALAKERFTRSIANLGLEDERASKAVQDRSDAALTRAKTISELEKMDTENLSRYLALIKMFEESNKESENRIKMQNVAVTEMAAEPDVQMSQQQQSIQEQPIQQQPQEVPQDERLL